MRGCSERDREREERKLMARERDCGRNGRERECVRSREKIAKEIDRKRRRDGEREIVYRD